MKFIKCILFICCALFFGCNDSKEGETFLQITLDGKEFDKLYLTIQLDKKETQEIEGNRINKFDWLFAINDSIYDRAEFTRIRIPSDDTTRYYISLSHIDKTSNDTIFESDSFFFDRSSKIYAKYTGPFIIGKDPFFSSGKYAIFECFATENKDNNIELSATSECHYYSRFYPGDYEENMEKYIKLTKKHNNSRYAIAQMANALTLYNSKDDVRKVYDYFSEDIKQTYYGKKVELYLSRIDFPNVELTVNGTEKTEKVITDFSKFNLVVFSASWCAPCHEQIPILKELYAKLGKDLIITYVSIDDSSTIKNWPKFIEKYQIPWRSLVIKENLEDVRDLYFVQTIPHGYLVYPSGEFKIIDVRKQEEEVYKAVGSLLPI